MARAAVLELLRADAQLADLGGAGFVVQAGFSYDQHPNPRGAFIVIMWRHTDFDEDIQDNAGEHFDLYVHSVVSESTDFGRINDIIDRVDRILRAATDGGTPHIGGDGKQLDHIVFEGRSMDLTDDKYQTICRYASYMALSSTVSE